MTSDQSVYPKVSKAGTRTWDECKTDEQKLMFIEHRLMYGYPITIPAMTWAFNYIMDVRKKAREEETEEYYYCESCHR